MIRSLLIVALMSWPSPAQIASPSHVWDPVFQESWTAWTHGEVERAHSLVGKGWVMVKRAGPNADGYADGVDLAYTTADYSGRTAESFYSEALKSTRSKRYNAVRLQILLRMSLRFTHQQEMRAKGLFEQAVKLSESMTPPPKTLRQTFVAFAELEDRMGEPEEAAKLRRRRDAIVGNAAREDLPLPRFGLSTDPNLISENFKQGQTFKGLVYGAGRLILEGEYERGSEAVDNAFDFAENFPRAVSGLQILFFGGVVSAYFHQGRIEEASKVLKRNLSLSEQPWGPGQVGTLVQVAWQYVNILRDYKTAGSLGDQAAKTVIAAGGERSDQMRGVEELKLRLAQVEDDPIAISEHTAKLRQLFIAVHGPKTKPLMIH